MTSAGSRFDTLSDVPVGFDSAEAINEAVLKPLGELCGVCISGVASPAFGTDLVPWGRSVKLPDGSYLQMRLSPQGLITRGYLAMKHCHLLGSEPIILAFRRTSARDESTSFRATVAHILEVGFALLWQPNELAKKRDQMPHPSDLVASGARTAGARNLHLLVPSIFEHHDAQSVHRRIQRDHKSGSVEVSPSPPYVILDNQNFHACRPSCYTVVRPPTPATTKTPARPLSTSAVNGLATFIVAGAFAGVGVKDPATTAAQTLDHTVWRNICASYAFTIEKATSAKLAFQAVHNANAVLDMLTCEGILALLANSFFIEAFSDNFHAPSGLPLLIMMCCRLACTGHERYKLPEPSNSDRVAIDRCRNLLESQFAPLPESETCGSGRDDMYAIDVVIDEAYLDANTHASDRRGADQAIANNLLLFYRAGIRCCSSVFGPFAETFEPPISQFGHNEALECPLAAAANDVLSRRLQAAGEGSLPTQNDYSLNAALGTSANRMNCLQTVMSSVETCLRTGKYIGIPLFLPNGISSQEDLVEKLKSRAREGENVDGSEEISMATKELQIATLDAAKTKLHQGLRESANEWRARGVDDAGEPYSDEKIKDIANQIESSTKQAILSLIGGDGSDTLTTINDSAFSHAQGTIATSFVEGSYLTTQLGMKCVLLSEHARQTCADCDKSVHALSHLLCESEFSMCPRCQRPRCFSCHHKAVSSKAKPKKSCKRCKKIAS